jgi:hypothetical protein
MADWLRPMVPEVTVRAGPCTPWDDGQGSSVAAEPDSVSRERRRCQRLKTPQPAPRLYRVSRKCPRWDKKLVAGAGFEPATFGL